MEQQLFLSMYEARAPWDIGRPQRDIVQLEESGQIRGSVLDSGCGTGENALFLASRGHETWGIDFAPVAIERAKAKAQQRGLTVEFRVGDALELSKVGRQFDTVIDCGLFHTFNDDERRRYVEELHRVISLKGLLFILCFSEDEPGTEGPRRLSQQEIRTAFQNGWKVQAIVPTRFEANDIPNGPRFSPGGPKAWLATIEKLEV